MMIFFLPTLCLITCGLSILFESKEQHALALKAKLAASLAFVGFAWDLGAWQSNYGQILLVGLALSLFGDVLLAMKGNKKWFLLGIGAFLLAHVFYTIAFAQTGFDTARLPLAAPVVLVFLSVTTLWLRKHLQGIFIIAVPAYLLAIGLMLVFAWGNQSMTAFWWIVVGATLFALSDLFVARNRFVQAAIINRIIGLPIYYVAQLILAYSVKYAQI